MQQEFFKIAPALQRIGEEAEKMCGEAFGRIDEISEYNQLKVLSAFTENHVSEYHLHGTTGYGYDDRGRDTLDAVFAQAMGCEDALVRHTFVSGTHALVTALFGVLRTGDTMVSLTGKPYDTLEEAIGIRGEGPCGSLKEYGIHYQEVAMAGEAPDYDAIPDACVGAKVAYIQRSRGYSLRPSLSVEAVGRMAKLARQKNPDIVVMVDNCYGEFVEKMEPTQVGADLIIGSLIKNPGGGLARTGGYIAGKAKWVEQCAYRLTAPGMGKEVGCSLEQNRELYMGLFFAPTTTANALKTAVFASALFELLGFGVTPRYDEERADIIQAVRLGDPERLIAFCQGVQKGAAVDAYVAPEPWDMPGYDSQVIMAAGAFTMGASIELSADAPLREPYAAWLQGGLIYSAAKMGILLAAQSMLDKGLLELR
ncbi:methionine gamma-lyase family protein [Zongyangia hominis]|uniref:Methionine gamma-lyase family protein n=1 Tax=Zongyangia hominis TaxID=2763677 RepID=A0A926IBP2_9FIRM|nr:methionine gamma-lyase family protein [Zongyangia hominis]MBC8570300.1 methionine gamma-lyase family protein [Zongyangia hominis]